ncbi:MAG TPA: hypothetical protein VGE52_17800, partial [Pirellulales bacterium]
PFPAEYEQFIAAEWTDRIALDALSEADSQELATVRLEAQSLALPLAELIWRRTQGNPLFIEQVVDHMTAAGLVEVREGIATLTSAADSGIEHAVPDTIRGLIAARIDRLRQTHQLTAKVSSVIGPLFAGRTLAAVYPDPAAAANLPEHVDALLQERIVRLDRPRPDDAYEFPHPVLQQVCYEMLPSVHRRRLHKIAAEWFQRDEAGGPLPYRLIAHHWGRAGDVAKQIEFLALAGDAAMRDGAFREAVTGFSEVLRLSREQTPDRPSQALVAQRAHWEYQLGQGRFGLGDLPGALDHLRESLRLRKRIARTSKVGLICDSLWLVARQAARRLWPTRWLSFAANRLGWKAKPKEEADQAGREAAAAYLRLSRVHYYMNNILPGTNATLRSLDLAESFGPSPELAIAYGTMMILCGLLNWGRAARVYSRLAEATTRAVGDIHNRAVVLSYLSMFHLGQGDFERVEALALESLELAEKLGDHQQSGEDATLLAMLGCLRADYAAAERWAERLLEASKRSGNAMHAGWALNILGEAHLRLRRPTEAVARLRESADKLRGNNDRTEEIRIHGMLAELAARAGDWDEAATQADAAEAIASAATAKTCSTLEGLAGIAEARFLRWEQAPPGSLPADVKRLAQQALRWLQQYARLYPVGRPRLSVFEGRWHRLTGAPLKAHQIWRDGLEQAVQLRMPYEAAVLHEWIASHYPEDSPERQEHLDEAALLFRQIGAPV